MAKHDLNRKSHRDSDSPKGERNAKTGQFVANMAGAALKSGKLRQNVRTIAGSVLTQRPRDSDVGRGITKRSSDSIKQFEDKYSDTLKRLAKR